MEISENYGFNLPSKDDGSIADIDKISENFKKIDNELFKTKPVIKTTAEITPWEVKVLMDEGKPFAISHTDSMYGAMLFNSFVYTQMVGSMLSSTVFETGGVKLCAQLLGNIAQNIWVFNAFMLEGGTVGNAVLYDPQTLTPEQQEQARENIGAASEYDSIFEEKPTGNLFNKDSTENVDGYLLQRGMQKESAGFSYSHPIAIQEGKTYYVAVQSSVNGVYVASLYNADGNALEKYGGTNPNAPTNDLTFQIYQEGNYWKVVIPEGIGATHMRCSFRNSTIGSMMVTESETAPTEYEPYVTQPGLTNQAEKIIGDEIQNITNPLWGKKISLNGDSICRGADSAGGYGKIIAENNNMTMQNVGKGGGTITAEVVDLNGKLTHCICRTIADMDADADYAIVEGGVNDSSYEVPLGALTADYGDTLDDTTFYGAFESMLKQLIIRFAGKKVGYIAVHQMSDFFRVGNEKETSYYWAAKRCCEKWGVPFLDLNTTVPPFGIIRNIKSQADLFAATRDAYTVKVAVEHDDGSVTYEGDGWHPTEEGYRKYYVPKIEAWLKTL